MTGNPQTGEIYDISGLIELSVTMIITTIYKAHIEMPLLLIEAQGKLETYIRMADLRVLVAAFKMVSHLARCGIFEVL